MLAKGKRRPAAFRGINWVTKDHVSPNETGFRAEHKEVVSGIIRGNRLPPGKDYFLHWDPLFLHQKNPQRVSHIQPAVATAPPFCVAPLEAKSAIRQSDPAKSLNQDISTR